MKKKSLSFIALLIVVCIFTTCSSEQDSLAPTPLLESDSTSIEENIESAPQDSSFSTQQTHTDNIAYLQFAVEDQMLEYYEILANDFEVINPHIRVQVRSIEEILGIDMTQSDVRYPEDWAYRLVTSADVVLYNFGRNVTEQGLVYDLSTLINSDPNFSSDDFYPNLLERYQWDGGTWAIPIRADYQLIFFNKDAFDAVDYPYPEVGWRWEDFLAAARATTVRDSQEVVQWGFSLIGSNHAAFLESLTNKPLVDLNAAPPILYFQDSEVITSIRWYTDLYLVHEVAPIFGSPTGSQNGEFPQLGGYNLIVSGKVAMWPSPATSWRQRGQPEHIGVVPYPQDIPDDKNNPITTSEGIFMSSGTKHPEEAWAWINYVLEQGSQDLGFQNSLLLPSRKSVAEITNYWSETDKELADALRYAVEHSYVGEWKPGYDALSRSIDDILAGSKEFDEALMDAVSEANEQIDALVKRDLETTSSAEVIVQPVHDGETNSNAEFLTFFIVGNAFSEKLKAYRDLAERFNQLNPDYFVEVSQFDSFGLKDLSGKSDCFQGSMNSISPTNLSYILSLDPFIDVDNTLDVTDFYPIAIESFTMQGQLWALPSGIQPRIIEFNKDLFDRAGVPYPALNWTLEDFFQITIDMTQGQEQTKQYGFVTYLIEANDLLVMLEQLGAQLVDESSDIPYPTFNASTTVNAMQLYSSLTTEFDAKPVFMTHPGDQFVPNAIDNDPAQLIVNERAAMWTNLAAIHITQNLEFRAGAVPLPTPSNNQLMEAYLDAEGFFISANTDSPQACWEWIKFLSEQLGSTLMMPARASVAESTAYRDLAGPDRVDAFLASLRSADEISTYTRFTNTWLGISFFWVASAYGDIVDGTLGVEEALNQAQEMANEYRSCVIAKDAFIDIMLQQGCAMEVDPTMSAFFQNR